MRKNSFLYILTAFLVAGVLGSCSSKFNNLNEDKKEVSNETQIKEGEEKQIQSISATKYITDYFVNTPISYQTTTIVAIYSDGSTENVTSKCSYEPAEGTVLSSIGEVPVTVTHSESGLTCNYNVVVNSEVFQSFELGEHKTNYYVGDAFYVNDVEVKGTTYLGKEVNITSLCQFNVQNNEVFNTGGYQEITISMPGFGELFSYQILVDSISAFTVNYDKAEYLIGDAFSYSDIHVVGTTMYGRQIEIDSDYRISIEDGYVFDTLGETTVWVTSSKYNLRKSYVITVVKEYIFNIKLDTQVKDPDSTYSNCYIHELYKRSEHLIFGFYSEYKDDVKDLTPIFCGEQLRDKIYLYYDKENSYSYILSEGRIVFNDADWNNYTISSYAPHIFGHSNAKEMILENIDVSKITSCKEMFNSCQNLTSLDISNLDLSSNTNTDEMFSYCINLKSIRFPKSLITSKVTSMYYMFGKCYELQHIDTTYFDFSNVTTMKYSFQECKKLTSIDFSNKDASKVTTFESTFYGCTYLKTINLSGFKTRDVTNMDYMFCNSGIVKNDDNEFFDLTNITTIDTSNVTSFSGMFYHCYDLKKVNLANLSTAKATTLSYMFYECTSLTYLDISNFSRTNYIPNQSHFLYGCSAFGKLYAKQSFISNSDNAWTGCSYVNLTYAAE